MESSTARRTNLNSAGASSKKLPRRAAPQFHGSRRDTSSCPNSFSTSRAHGLLPLSPHLDWPLTASDCPQEPAARSSWWIRIELHERQPCTRGESAAHAHLRKSTPRKLPLDETNRPPSDRPLREQLRPPNLVGRRRLRRIHAIERCQSKLCRRTCLRRTQNWVPPKRSVPRRPRMAGFRIRSSSLTASPLEIDSLVFCCPSLDPFIPPPLKVARPEDFQTGYIADQLALSRLNPIVFHRSRATPRLSLFSLGAAEWVIKSAGSGSVVVLVSSLDS